MTKRWKTKESGVERGISVSGIGVDCQIAGGNVWSVYAVVVDAVRNRWGGGVPPSLFRQYSYKSLQINNLTTCRHRNFATPNAPSYPFELNLVLDYDPHGRYCPNFKSSTTETRRPRCLARPSPAGFYKGFSSMDSVTPWSKRQIRTLPKNQTLPLYMTVS